MVWCFQCGCMVVRWGCGILLSVGFAVPLGQSKFSDLAFSNALVRPSLILHYAWYAIVEPLVGFSSVAVPAAPAVLRGMNCRRFPSVVIQPFWLRLPVLLLCWRCGLGSRLSLCFLSASPALARVPMIAGCRSLWGWFCQGGCDCLAVWWCLRTL